MRRSVTLALCLSLAASALSGCAGTFTRPGTEPPATIEVRPAADEPPEAAPARRWQADLHAITREMQQAALEQGAVSVDRTTDDRLFIRMPVAAAFAQQTLMPTRPTVEFIEMLSAALHRHDGTCVTLAENPPIQQRKRPGPKPYHRAAAMRELLINQGVDAGRLAIEVLGYHEVSMGETWPLQDRIAPHVEFMLYSCTG